MPERRPCGRFRLLALGLVIAVMLAAPLSVAADTGTVTSIGVGASVTFSGNGFAPNETLSVWQTGPAGPNETIVPLPGVQTDGSGAFSITISFPSAGSWQATAHSINSGKELVNRYAVGTTTGTTTVPVTTSPVTSAPAPVTTGTSAPSGFTPVASGASVTFSGSGFTANEVIALWETSPSSAVTALPDTGADSNGAFTTTVIFPSDGNWQITAHGKTSLKEVIGRYAVGTTTGTTTAPTTSTGASPSSGGFSNLPPVTLGSPITFSGTGFNGGEPISLWDTAPDSSVAALPSVSADGIGGFTTTVTFPSAGNWQITAQGRDSRHQVIGRYTVVSDATTTTSTTPSAPFVSPTADVPLKATAGGVVTFSATGFNAGEMITAWSTGPDGKVLPIDSTSATSNGRATVSVSFSTTGLWQVTLKGKDSGRVVVGKYQVTEATQVT